MSASSLRRAIGPSGPIVIDSSVVLSYLNGTDAFSAAAAVVFDDLVGSGAYPGVLSAATVTEVLVRPLRSDASAAAVIETFLQNFANLRVAPVDYPVAREAARIRAATGLRTPDALILATAVVHRAQAVITTDDRWRAAAGVLVGVRLVDLGDHTSR